MYGQPPPIKAKVRATGKGIWGMPEKSCYPKVPKCLKSVDNDKNVKLLTSVWDVDSLVGASINGTARSTDWTDQLTNHFTI